MRRWVVAVDAAAEDADGRPVGLQRPSVRVGIDTASEAADDDDAGCRELAAQHASDGRAVARARARPHDRDRRARKDLRLAAPAQEEARRWVVDRAQERRERRVGAPDEAYAPARELRREPGRVEGVQKRAEAGAARCRDDMGAARGRERSERQIARHAAASSAGAR